jgi:hydroxymethylbilane synthase
LSATFRVGTRRSLLARTQTDWVVARLRRAQPGATFVVRPLDASGDKDRFPGGSPDFTDTLDRAVVHRDLDFAVHSAKDLAVELEPRLSLVACPRRADPRDCLLADTPRRAASPPRGARVGSSSPRRRAQLLRWRPDLDIVEIRGNVDTRIEKLRSKEVDLLILAVAGLVRLGRATEIGRILPSATFVPAPAQGALAVVARAGDARVRALVGGIDHGPTRAAIEAERALAAALGGNCQLPLGARAIVDGRTLRLVGEVLSGDGRRSMRRRSEGPASRAVDIGARLGNELLRHGARELMGAPSPGGR